MGFRDLHAFKLAMLSKQAWRLTEDTNLEEEQCHLVY